MQEGNEATIGALLCIPENRSVAPYSRPLLAIERNFDHGAAFTWFSSNWTLCYYFIAAYLLVIFLGHEWMRHRQPFQLRGALLFWNVALAAYSALSAWRMVTALLYAVDTYGFAATLCETSPLELRQSVALWNFLFTFSKILEFGDTAFIVLRKQRLLFLHWYHHVSVTFFAWSPGAHGAPMQAYFTAVNLSVLAVMYTYFALRVLGIRLPKAISSVTVTYSLQLLHMAATIGVTAYAYRAKVADPTCAVAIAANIYGSYFVLFLNFFVRSYVRMKTAFCDRHRKKLI